MLSALDVNVTANCWLTTDKGLGCPNPAEWAPPHSLHFVIGPLLCSLTLAPISLLLKHCSTFALPIAYRFGFKLLLSMAPVSAPYLIVRSEVHKACTPISERMAFCKTDVIGLGKLYCTIWLVAKHSRSHHRFHRILSSVLSWAYREIRAKSHISQKELSARSAIAGSERGSAYQRVFDPQGPV